MCIVLSSTAIELNPNYVRAILRRAELYEKTDKLDEALEDYKTVLEKDPGIPAAREACMVSGSISPVHSILDSKTPIVYNNIRILNTAEYCKLYIRFPTVLTNDFTSLLQLMIHQIRIIENMSVKCQALS